MPSPEVPPRWLPSRRAGPKSQSVKKPSGKKATKPAPAQDREAEEFEQIAAKIAIELNADPADEEVQQLAVFEQVARRKS